jgi:hypothetical protein
MTKRSPLYRITADHETGEWLSRPELIGECDLAKLPADTDDVHYDTFDAETAETIPSLREAGETRTCGIEIHYR